MEEGSWDDFANNLATDLAPFITLFGEQVTKQYLSESVGFLDNLIFALAPLGILTAVVSAIRVSGSPSLRAFIGRAQEGPGIAEVELLSCTSETTAELWNDGGISRVFGKPMLLEVAVDDDESTTHDPIINFVCDADNSWEEKVKSTGDTGCNSDNDADLRRQFMKSSPNLSLNKGIKKRNQVWFYAVALVGVCLVIGMPLFKNCVAGLLTQNHRCFDIRSNHGLRITFYVSERRQTRGTIFISMLSCRNDCR